MEYRSHKSYCITIRPKDGISNQQIIDYQAWVAKKTEYSYTVTEKEHTERHIHSAIFFKEPQRIDNVKRSIIGLLKLSDTEKRVAVCIKSMYSHDWLSYCKKGDSTQVIHSNLPEEHMLEAYFTTSTDRSSKKSTKLTFYSKLESLWYEQRTPADEVNPRTCRDFLFKLMYHDRVIEPLRDDRTIIQVSRHLSRYINKYETSCIDVNNTFEKDE